MKQEVGIHYQPYYQFDARLHRYEAILEFNGINTRRLSSSRPDFWRQVRELDLFIYYWGQWDVTRQVARAIMRVIEQEYDIPCFPNVRTAWMFDDKIREYYLMQAHGFPMIKSWIFWEEKDALHWADDATLPVVFKLAGGAGARAVVLVTERRQLLKLIRQMFHHGCHSDRVPGRGSLATGGKRPVKLCVICCC